MPTSAPSRGTISNAPADAVPAHSDSPRALIRYALVGLALTVAISWSLYLVRGALLLVYMSVLVAIGLAPLAGAIERYRLPGSRRLPRWAAILIIYLCFIGVLVGVGLLVIPPLVAQARELWSALPDMVQRGQQWLIDRGLLTREVSFGEALQQANGQGDPTPSARSSAPSGDSSAASSASSPF